MKADITITRKYTRGRSYAIITPENRLAVNWLQRKTSFTEHSLIIDFETLEEFIQLLEKAELIYDDKT